LPLRFTSSPGAIGVVLDAHSRPLAGAEVFVSTVRWRWPTVTNAVPGQVDLDLNGEYLPPPLSEAIINARLPIAITGSDGRFLIPAEKRWGILILPLGLMGDVFPASGTLVVRRDAYEPAMVLIMADDEDKIREILMMPVTK
jgi:hypothetical protein